MSDQQRVSFIAPENKNTSSLIQAPVSSNPETPNVINYTSFGQNSVRVLKTDDFDRSGQENLITLNNKSCSLVLFYAENGESHNLMKIFSLVAQQTVGPLFAAVNLLSETKIAQAFNKLKENKSGPYYQFSLWGIPSIIVYRSGQPVAFYNGERSVQSLLDYSLTLACNVDYFEKYQRSVGMQAEGPYEMTSIQSNPENRLKSTDFDSVLPIRRYEPNLPIYRSGSEEEIKFKELRKKQDEELGQLQTNQILEQNKKDEAILGETESQKEQVEKSEKITFERDQDNTSEDIQNNIEKEV